MFYIIYEDKYVKSGPGYISCVSSTPIEICNDSTSANDICIQRSQRVDHDRYRYRYVEKKSLTIELGVVKL